MDDNKLLHLKTTARTLRKYIITMNCMAGTGHPGGSLSSADIISYLFEYELNFSPDNAKDKNRDRFILSKGHACPALYAALAHKGFFDVSAFKTLRQVNGMLEGHPDRLKTPGVECNTGSLGQGLSFSLGVALGGKRNKQDFRVYTIVGDGELNEGQCWEAFMFGSHYHLDNITVVVDYNKIQSDDFCDNVTSLEPLHDKLKAFGWHVIEIHGHDFIQIESAFDRAKKIKGIPTIIIAHTIKGKGVSFMENIPKWHGSMAPQGNERHIAFRELDIEDFS